jgi:hypothetical protein
MLFIHRHFFYYRTQQTKHDNSDNSMVFRIAPKSAIVEAFNQFVDLAVAKQGIDAFTIRRLESEAKKCINVDAVISYVFQGALSAYCFDKETSKQRHLNAMNLERSAFTLSNYSVSLGMFGETTEALKHARDAIALEPEDLSLVEKAIEMAVEAGSINQCLELFDMLQVRANRISHYQPLIIGIKQVLDANQIPYEDYEDGVRVLRQFLFSREMRILETDCELLLSPGDEALLYYVKVGASLDNVLVAQDEVAIALADDLGDRWHPNSVMFEIRSADGY